MFITTLLGAVAFGWAVTGLLHVLSGDDPVRATAAFGVPAIVFALLVIASAIREKKS